MVAANDELRARNSELVLLTSDLTNVFSSAELALLILDRDLRIRRYTPMAAQLFHLIPADVGRPIGQLQPEIDATDLERLVQEVMDTGAARHREVADPAGRWYSLRVRPYRTAGNQIDGAVLAYIDITALKQSQQALWESEHRYRVVSELTSDFAYAVRVEGDGRLIREWATEALTRITGYTPPQIDAIGWEAVVHPDDRPAWREYWQRVLTSHTGALDYRILTKSGGQRWLRDQARVEGGEAVRVIGAAQDITESKRAEEALHQSEERLRQSQKMEAIGRLAGGVAHDFNNLLTAVQGYSELLLEELAGQEPLRQEVEEIHKAAQRATALTGQLLAFSRRQVLQPKVLDLNGLVGDLDKMLRRLIGEHIELDTVPGRDLGSVQADPSRLEQVVVNLVVNACDAMPCGGRLTIETANVTVDPGGSSASDEARPGPFVMVSVTDTGCGMDAETRSRLFEPFFTTKPKGQGTGLGLCTVYGIVRQSGGFIDVESEPGRGATFRIYLPRAEAPAPAPEPVEVVVAKPARGSETVLLVEDDAPVRTLARSILKRNGYRLLEARHGRDALRLAAQHHHAIHLLLTDVVMPGMGGPQLAEKLSRQRPGMKVLFMSGYTSGILGRDMVLDPDTAFLEKPFSGETLARKVRQTLDAG